MANVLVDRSTPKAASRLVFERRVHYISDPDHPDHSGKKKKLILPARNYNVPYDDQSPAAFIDAVIQCDTEYHQSRWGKVGKRSRRLFEELIYSTEPGAWLTEEERNEIERRIVSRFGGMSVCRTAWHIDEKTGRCDLHVLMASKTLDFPPTMTLWAEFGGCNRDHIYAAMDSLDVEIERYLNQRPKRQKARLRSAQCRHQKMAAAVIGKQEPLALLLAKHFAFMGIEPADVDQASLVAAIEDLGHKVPRVTDNLIFVRFLGRKTPRRYNRENLLDCSQVVLERLKHGLPSGDASKLDDIAPDLHEPAAPLSPSKAACKSVAANSAEEMTRS